MRWGRGLEELEKERGFRLWVGVFYGGTMWQSWGNRSVPKTLKPSLTTEMAGKVRWVNWSGE